MDTECQICMDSPASLQACVAGHRFCGPCLSKWSRTREHAGMTPTCPTCRSEIVDHSHDAPPPSYSGVRDRLEREHSERNALRVRRLEVEARVAAYTAAAVWTPSGRPFESLPLVRDTSHLREIMAENRSAIYGGAARDYKYALRDTRY